MTTGTHRSWLRPATGARSPGDSPQPASHCCGSEGGALPEPEPPVPSPPMSWVAWPFPPDWRRKVPQKGEVLPAFVTPIPSASTRSKLATALASVAAFTAGATPVSRGVGGTTILLADRPQQNIVVSHLPCHRKDLTEQLVNNEVTGVEGSPPATEGWRQPEDWS